MNDLLVLPIADISPDPSQPRTIFDQEKLNELASSIRENGLIQPITVRQDGDKWVIVTGERRWRAHRILGLRTIKATVTNAVGDQIFIEQIIENISRADMTPLEEGKAFKRMLDRGLTAEDLARKLGRPKFRIEERVRMMGLDPTIFKLCELGQFDHHVAQTIAILPAHADQIALTKLWNSGAIVGFRALKAAVAAKAEGLTQTDIFGADAFTPSEKCIALRVGAEEIQTVGHMEQRVGIVADMVAKGWKDGACIVAAKVSRDRARLMADKLKAIRSAIVIMENDLRAAAAQAEIAMAA